MKKVIYFLLCLYAQSELFSSQASPKIVVIGAGFAGLTAAYRLHQKGLNVEVYEARHRVGGRVFSVNILGEIAELGAQNIRDGGEAVNLLALVNELHLETEGKKIPFRFPYVDEQGAHDFQTLLQGKHFEKETLYQELQEKAKDAQTMEEILLALFNPEDLLYKACSAILTSYEGACPAKLSSQCVGTLYQILLGGLCAVHPNTDTKEIERLVIRGGNGLLAERLAQALASNVHLNEQLTKISKNEDGAYFLTFKSGKQITADQLILTLPCPVYQDLSIDEAVIPKEQQERIRALPCATTSKLLVPVLPVVDGMGRGCISDHVNLFNLTGGHVLTLYYFNAHASFRAETITQRFQETLPIVEKFYLRQNSDQPCVARDASFAYYEGAVGHSWPNDLFARGSYSYIPAGQEESYASVIEVENERVKSLFAPINRTLFFAGEHTCVHLEICGTMEAAVESGERTARLLLKHASLHEKCANERTALEKSR
jgi:monoamine oxidase